MPYTGAGPLGNALALDKVITKTLMRDRGVPTPNFRVMRRSTETTCDLRFPVVVKPRSESTSFGLQIAHEPAQLRQAVEAIVTQYAQDALVEEYIEGREIYVGLLGNGEPETLPLVEQDFGDREMRIFTNDDKERMALAPICPAQVDSRLATMLRDMSVATFRACQCRDYARVDIRIDRSGQPFVLEINSIPALRGIYVQAASAAGYSFSSLINRILDVAHTRYFGVGAPSRNARRLATQVLRISSMLGSRSAARMDSMQGASLAMCGCVTYQMPQYCCLPVSCRSLFQRTACRAT